MRKAAILKFFLGCFLILCFWQCSPDKNDYLKDFEKFILETEKNADTQSEAEWLKTLTKYNDYCGKSFEQFKEELSADDKIKIGFLKSRFSSFSLKREAAKLQQELKR